MIHNLRYQINKYIFETGYAPGVLQLSELMRLSRSEVESGLQLLAESHAIVLHPGTFDIWVAHPFALFPTLFWVKSGEKQWWGNCPWCSFGIASLSKSDTTIYTKLSGEEDAIIIEIKNGKVVQDDLVVHFPIPAKDFWNNVIYTCSMMLVFRKHSEVDLCCTLHNKPRGEVLPIQQVLDLARKWYGNYLSEDFTLKSKERAQEIFEEMGMVSDFWKL